MSSLDHRPPDLPRSLPPLDPVGRAAAGAGLFLPVYALGFNEIHQDVCAAAAATVLAAATKSCNFLLLAGLYAVNFLTRDDDGADLGGHALRRDRFGHDPHHGQQAVRRWEIVVGKWLGFTVMLTLYLLLMAGGVALVVRVISGYTAAQPAGRGWP